MDFNILACSRFIAKCKEASPQRFVRNYEFDFYPTANRSITIDNKTSSITDGCICFKKPGQIVSSIGDYDCYMLTIDFSKSVSPYNYQRNTALYTEPLNNNPLISNMPDIFVSRHINDLTILFSTLSKQVDLNSKTSRLCFEEILHIINADLKHIERKNYIYKKTPADDVLQYINKNFSKQLTLSDLANYACISESYLVRLFKAQYSITPIDYLIQCRLNYSKDLLVNTNLSVSEIATLCGYNNSTFYGTQFKRFFHITPLQYRIQSTTPNQIQ